MSVAAAALAMGVLGSSHCAAMCGGIAAALTTAPAGARNTRTLHVLVQNAGRVASYATAGAVAGAAGSMAAGAGGAEGMLALRSLAALVTIAAGLQIGGWASLLVKLEAAGSVVWRRIVPLAGRARRSRSLAGAALFGALWGWLPCGLVYSALVLAASSGSAADGAVAMVAFGIGTVPATLAIGVLASRGVSLLRGVSARRLAGAMVIVFGVWTFAAAATAYRDTAGSDPGACHAHAETPR